MITRRQVLGSGAVAGLAWSLPPAAASVPAADLSDELDYLVVRHRRVTVHAPQATLLIRSFLARTLSS